MYVSWPVQYMLNDVLRNPRGHKKVYSVCECPVCALKRGGAYQNVTPVTNVILSLKQAVVDTSYVYT